MAVTLVGEVVNTADSATGYNAGGISGDDDFVQGTGALGIKASNTTQILQTTSLGATAPYNFSSGGSEFGWHLIGWFNTKTPISATGGLRFFIGNSSTNFVQYNVDPTVFYKGGFITKVINPARNANVAGGTFTTTGNPAQLTSINNMGMVFDTITSIMGSFNNVQIDQFTIGLGVRVDGGLSFAPNQFETVRVADEDTNFWGWWGSTQGAYIGKGKLFIGPATGSAASFFEDSAESVIFADELVATGFYEIAIRGGGTDVTWNLMNITTANVANNRWNLTVDSTTLSFEDTNSTFTNGGTLSLNSNSTLTGTLFIRTTELIQNGATLDGITVLNPSITNNVAFLKANNPSLISDCFFSGTGQAPFGHAIEITTPGTYSFVGNRFEPFQYGNGAGNETIYNNSGGLVTLNISGGGDTPTIRNGTGASTVVNNTVPISVEVINTAGNPVQNARVLLEAASGGDLTAGTDILAGLTDVNGLLQDTGFNFTNNQPVTGRVRKSSTSPFYKTGNITGTITSSGFSVTVQLVEDE